MKFMCEEMTAEQVAAEVAEAVAGSLERDATLSRVDWNDLGEVTVGLGGRTFRMTVRDVTDELDA